MNIHLDNVSFASNSGPNSFAGKLVRYFDENGVSVIQQNAPDAYLCFIEATKRHFDAQMFQ